MFNKSTANVKLYEIIILRHIIWMRFGAKQLLWINAKMVIFIRDSLIIIKQARRMRK